MFSLFSFFYSSREQNIPDERHPQEKLFDLISTLELPEECIEQLFSIFETILIKSDELSQLFLSTSSEYFLWEPRHISAEMMPKILENSKLLSTLIHGLPIDTAKPAIERFFLFWQQERMLFNTKYQLEYFIMSKAVSLCVTTEKVASIRNAVLKQFVHILEHVRVNSFFKVCDKQHQDLYETCYKVFNQFKQTVNEAFTVDEETLTMKLKRISLDSCIKEQSAEDIQGEYYGRVAWV